jgi:hypothetical protein
MKSMFHVALLSLVIALVAGITTSTILPQAFAEPQLKAQDDKNNPTFPGGQSGKDSPPDNAQNGHAVDNRDANCEKHANPAQCY